MNNKCINCSYWHKRSRALVLKKSRTLGECEKFINDCINLRMRLDYELCEFHKRNDNNEIIEEKVIPIKESLWRRFVKIVRCGRN